MENDIFEKIREQIYEAEKQALLKGMETNAIILNENHAYVKEFYIAIKMGFESVGRNFPPMILGKKLFLDPLPENYDFALTYVKEPENPLKSLMKKYVKIIGKDENEQLVFKGVSTKRNKNDFEMIKRLLGL